MKKIAIQGLKGSYSHQAVEKIAKKLKEKFEILENDTFESAFDAIKKYGIGLIPVENSTAGFVEKTIDELIKYDFEIIGETSLEIKHVLLGDKKTSLDKIKEVYSHQQALAQVSKFLKKNKIKAVEYYDTALGAKFISEKNNLEFGAIGSKILAKLYGLKILAENINNVNDNKTRFFLIKRKDFKLKLKEKKKKKIALIFKTKNIPGALFKVLGGFATNSVNLTRIVSRPHPIDKFEYYFFVAFDGDLKAKNVQQALKEVEFFSDEVRLLGEFSEI